MLRSASAILRMRRGGARKLQAADDIEEAGLELEAAAGETVGIEIVGDGADHDGDAFGQQRAGEIGGVVGNGGPEVHHENTWPPVHGCTSFSGCADDLLVEAEVVGGHAVGGELIGHECGGQASPRV